MYVALSPRTPSAKPLQHPPGRRSHPPAENHTLAGTILTEAAAPPTLLA